MLHVSNGAAFALVDRTFSHLVLMPLCGFNCLGVLLFDVAFSQHLPAHKVAHFDGFEPSYFDRASTEGVHPFDGSLRPFGDCRHCWFDLVLSVLVRMGVVVANVPVVASTVFGIFLGYLGCQ